jgi:thymidylate synthase
MFTQYEEYLRHVYTNGREKTDRTGTGTKAVFGYQMRWNLQEGFPLVTTKKMFTKGIIAELIWFLEGSTDNNRLRELGTTIWDEWAREDGSLGPIYGHQWRSWPGKVEKVTEELQLEHSEWKYHGMANYPFGMAYVQKPIDQIQIAIDTLRKSPDSRRIIVSAWNVADLPEMSLTPCHCLFQFYTETATVDERATWAVKEKRAHKDGTFVELLKDEDFDKMEIPKLRLSCQLYQRSCDSFLGVPFNIASYAMLTEMFAQQVNMIPGDFIWTGGDCHIYSNHYAQVEEQLSRQILQQPTLRLNKAPSIFEYKVEDFVIEGYQSHAGIKAPIAV